MRYPKYAARLIGFATLMGAMAAVPASAQDYVTPTYVGTTQQDVGVLDRPRPAYDAKGIPMGGFRLFPTLDLFGSYDDNVFRQPTGQSDYFFTVSLTLRLQSQWGRHFLEVYAGLNNYDYAKLSAQNLTDWKVGTDGRLDISRSAMLTANVFYGEMHELWSAPNNVVRFQASPNRYYQTHAEVVTAYQPNRLGIGFGGSFDRYDWMSTPAIGGGTLFNSDRNQDEYQAYTKVFYDFSPGYSGFVKASYDGRHFDHLFDRAGFDRSSHGYRYDGGLDMQITHLVSGEVFIGYLQQYYVQSVPTPLKNVSGLDYGVKLDWYASPLLTVHLNGSRQLQDVVLSGASVSDSKGINLSADYEFRPNIILQGNVDYTSARLVGTTRTDNYPGAGIGVKYLLNSYMSADLSYAYSERTSNSTGINYTDNTVSIGLNLHI
ncbi:MAG: outer membrane beta-barrel protein [Alphaproteobacteria bacterium]|nr:outer membrane beta-barrel protein [Alphaproteobacteria bacterium]